MQFAIRYTEGHEGAVHVAHFETDEGRKVYIGRFEVESATGEYRSMSDSSKMEVVKPNPERGWETEVYVTYGEWASACALTAAEWIGTGPPEPGWESTGAMEINTSDTLGGMDIS